MKLVKTHPRFSFFLCNVLIVQSDPFRSKCKVNEEGTANGRLPLMILL